MAERLVSGAGPSPKGDMRSGMLYTPIGFWLQRISALDVPRRPKLRCGAAELCDPSGMYL